MSNGIIEDAMRKAMSSPECYETPKSNPVKKKVNSMGSRDGSVLAEARCKKRQQEEQKRGEQ